MHGVSENSCQNAGIQKIMYICSLEHKAKKMAKYLDPKIDVLFKKTFGENKELIISFLNLCVRVCRRRSDIAKQHQIFGR